MGQELGTSEIQLMKKPANNNRLHSNTKASIHTAELGQHKNVSSLSMEYCNNFERKGVKDKKKSEFKTQGATKEIT